MVGVGRVSPQPGTHFRVWVSARWAPAVHHEAKVVRIHGEWTLEELLGAAPLPGFIGALGMKQRLGWARVAAALGRLCGVWCKVYGFWAILWSL